MSIYIYQRFIYYKTNSTQNNSSESQHKVNITIQMKIYVVIFLQITS